MSRPNSPVHPCEVFSWPPTVDVPTAGSTIGLGVNASYESYHRGDFPFRVLKVGRRLRVPTSSIIEVLGLSQSGPVDAA